MQCDTVSYIANPFIHVFLQAGIFIKESLVWFVDLGLCCTINTGSSTWTLRHATTQASHCCTVSWRFCRTNHPVHLFQQARDELDVRVGQHINLVLALGVFRVDQLSSSPVSSSATWYLQNCPGQLTFAVMSKGQGQFSCFHILRVGSPTPTISGPTVLCSPGKVQGPYLECCSQ